MGADSLSLNMAGMSKRELFEIMCQMQTLTEQNKQQARQILVQNPSLTKALFQAQIMLNIVHPVTQAAKIPAIQPTVTLNPQRSASQLAQSNVQTTPSLPPRQTGIHEQTRKQQQNHPAPTVPSTSLPPPNLQSQSLPSRPVQQPKGHIGVQQATPISLPQTSQVHMPPLAHHSASPLPPHLQPQMAPASSQLEQPMQSGGNQHMAMPPQLPPSQVRPSMQPFPQQVHPHMGPNVSFPQSGPAQHHHSQPNYHPALRPPSSMGPSFLSGQPSGPSQLPPQSLYQMGGSHLRPEFNQGGSSMQADRASPWIPGLPENNNSNNTSGTQLPGPPPFRGQMGPSNPPPRSASLTPEMENALLEQVRSLTPEQINLLPPEQRNQVLQLQQMLR